MGGVEGRQEIFEERGKLVDSGEKILTMLARLIEQISRNHFWRYTMIYFKNRGDFFRLTLYRKVLYEASSNYSETEEGGLHNPQR